MKIHEPGEFIQDVNVALQMLKEGNERYLKGELIQKSSNIYSADRKVLSNSQTPFAVVITCSDSRVAPEIFFDQKLGDIFVIRNAGNIVDTTTFGTLEFAIDRLRTRLIVVCGHSRCSMITEAYLGNELPPNITHIAEYIKPAIEKGGGIDKVIHNNVEVMVEKIKANDMVKNLGVLVVGACYDIPSGVVEWL